MWKKVQGGYEKREQSDGDASGVTKETREGLSEKQQNFCSFKHWLLRKASKCLVWYLMKTWSQSERLSQSCYSCSPTGVQNLTFWPGWAIAPQDKHSPADISFFNIYF